LVLTEDLKTIDSNCQHRFAYKFAPLPIHPYLNSKKTKKKANDIYNAASVSAPAEPKVGNDQEAQQGVYQRKDGICLHNAMSVCFHPFLLGTTDSSPSLFYKARLLPFLLNYFEKTCYLKDINYELFSNDVHPLDRKMPPAELVTKKKQDAGYKR